MSDYCKACQVDDNHVKLNDDGRHVDKYAVGCDLAMILHERDKALSERNEARAERDELNVLLLEAFKQSDDCLDFYYEQSTFYEDFYHWKQGLQREARRAKTLLSDQLQPVLDWLTLRKERQSKQNDTHQ
jgi:hypothetical protein